MTPPQSWPADHPVDSWNDLCIFLGGSNDSFTGLLLQLIAKADPGNKARLRRAYPREVAAWELWMAFAPVSHSDLTARLDRKLNGQ